MTHSEIQTHNLTVTTPILLSEYLRARVGYVEFLAKMTFSHHLIAFKELYPTVKLDFSKYELN